MVLQFRIQLKPQSDQVWKRFDLTHSQQVPTRFPLAPRNPWFPPPSCMQSFGDAPVVITCAKTSRLALLAHGGLFHSCFLSSRPYKFMPKMSTSPQIAANLDSFSLGEHIHCPQDVAALAIEARNGSQPAIAIPAGRWLSTSFSFRAILRGHTPDTFGCIIIHYSIYTTIYYYLLLVLVPLAPLACPLFHTTLQPTMPCPPPGHQEVLTQLLQ